MTTEMDAAGVRRLVIDSPYQAGATTVRLYEPTAGVDPETERVLYVLPVEPGEGAAFGDGLAEVLRLGLPDRYRMLVVAPSFSSMPWYADHPTDAARRDESYLLREVVPLVEEQVPLRAPRRLLVGFSKSGFGAVSLLLRHPDVWEAAATWDAPLMEHSPDRFAMAGAFGDQAGYEPYHIARLVAERASDLRGPARLGLAGYGNFRDEMTAAHALLERLGIAHEYRDGPERAHDWHSGWLAEAVDALIRMDNARHERGTA
jgi:hypothetical protein